ncbi:hypothetical protein IV203_021130 [Nitzschia inconspicua]|uniref:Uncharacterized protein n=1 Tax=Nitzschia inconspicua TaxID=303405 RepID=A0A9K3KHC1_9STRA|nr:hypothetical protein IV203_021130 [Nitzschia inconspicua]
MPKTPKPSKGRDDDEGTNTSDSDFPGSSSAPHSYNIPQWLIPEKQTAKYFSVALPAVPIQVEQAIRSRLKKQYSQSEYKESTKVIHHISQLQHDEKQANHKVKMAKEKLATAVAAKNDGIEQLRKTSEGDTLKALENLEKSMRKDQEKEYRQAKEKIKAQVRAEYDQKFEEERDKKRKRDQEAQQKQEEEEKRAKQQQFDDAESEEEGEERPTEGMSKIAELEKKRVELQDKMEKLSEKKSEMFWLLKTVIMQENKQKIEHLKKQKKAEESKNSV